MRLAFTQLEKTHILSIRKQIVNCSHLDKLLQKQCADFTVLAFKILSQVNHK